MKKSLVASTFALALAASGGAQAVGVIDISATGAGAGYDFRIDNIGLQAGYSLMKDLVPGGSTGDFLSQAHVFLNSNPLYPNAVLTYQFKFTGIGSTAVGGNNIVIGAPGATGVFELFFDPDSTDGIGFDPTSGTGIGYGTLNGATGGTGQTKLLAGTVKMQNAIALTQDITDPSFYWLSLNDTGGVATINWGGNGNFTVDVTTQNRFFTTNEMVGATVNMQDIQLLNQGNGSPMQTNDKPSNIVGVPIVAADYGVAQSTTVQTTFPDPGQTGGSTVVSVPRNDGSCNALFTTCIATFQTSGTLDFKGPAVPEPGSLALVGLSVGLAGLIGARRRRAALKARAA